MSMHPDAMDFFRRVMALKRAVEPYINGRKMPMDRETQLEAGRALDALGAEYLLAVQDYFLDLEQTVRQVKNIMRTE